MGVKGQRLPDDGVIWRCHVINDRCGVNILDLRVLAGGFDQDFKGLRLNVACYAWVVDVGCCDRPPCVRLCLSAKDGFKGSTKSIIVTMRYPLLSNQRHRVINGKEGVLFGDNLVLDRARILIVNVAAEKMERARSRSHVEADVLAEQSCRVWQERR